MFQKRVADLQRYIISWSGDPHPKEQISGIKSLPNLLPSVKKQPPALAWMSQVECAMKTKNASRTVYNLMDQDRKIY